MRLEGGFKRGGRIRAAECLRQIVPNRWANVRKWSFTQCFCIYRRGVRRAYYKLTEWLFLHSIIPWFSADSLFSSQMWLWMSDYRVILNTQRNGDVLTVTALFGCDMADVTMSVHSFARWSPPEVIVLRWSFHLLLDPRYRVSPASYAKCSVSAGRWYWRPYFLPVQGKHFPVKTGICWSRGGSDSYKVAEVVHGKR